MSGKAKVPKYSMSINPKPTKYLEYLPEIIRGKRMAAHGNITIEAMYQSLYQLKGFHFQAKRLVLLYIQFKVLMATLRDPYTLVGMMKE